MKAAVILAGGYGTRFGGPEKAVVDVAGRPMISRVLEAVGPVVDEVVVNAREDQREAIDAALSGGDTPYRYALDEVPDRGPLAGIATGLSATEAEYSLVVACDMPLVDPAFVAHLFERAAGHDAAIPVQRRGGSDWPQPLQAVYRTTRMQAVARESLAEGLDSPLDAIERLGFVPVSIGEAPDGVDGTTLWNVNTREELRDVERRLAGVD
ncbi:MAG: molybdenum cofactor guanylyltransferase [Halanaeroarchaeum sp.]